MSEVTIKTYDRSRPDITVCTVEELDGELDRLAAECCVGQGGRIGAVGRAGGGQPVVTVGGFSIPEILVFDVTDNQEGVGTLTGKTTAAASLTGNNAIAALANFAAGTGFTLNDGVGVTVVTVSIRFCSG